MKASEIRKMSAAELNEKLVSLKKDLFFLRMQHATNQLDNPRSSVTLPESRPLSASSRPLPLSKRRR